MVWWGKKELLKRKYRDVLNVDKALGVGGVITLISLSLILLTANSTRAERLNESL